MGLGHQSPQPNRTQIKTHCLPCFDASVFCFPFPTLRIPEFLRRFPNHSHAAITIYISQSNPSRCKKIYLLQDFKAFVTDSPKQPLFVFLSFSFFFCSISKMAKEGPNWDGLLKWSIAHSDGTRPTGNLRYDSISTFAPFFVFLFFIYPIFWELKLCLALHNDNDSG